MTPPWLHGQSEGRKKGRGSEVREEMRGEGRGRNDSGIWRRWSHLRGGGMGTVSSQPNWSYMHTHTHTQSLNTSGGFDKKQPPTSSLLFCRLSSTPWQAAGLSTTTCCHYTDYYPCQSHAPPPSGAGKGGRESKGSGCSDGRSLSLWYILNERSKHDCQGH